MGDEDAALLEAVCGGSERAFNTLIDRHQQAVRAFLRGLTSHADADDLAQETFLAVWRRPHAFRGGGSVRSWLFAIAWRKAKDGQRRWFRGAARDAAWLDASQGGGEAGSDTRLALKQSLMELSLDQRAAVVLCLGQGFTHEEASTTLGLPLGTVKSHVARGREKLRGLLGDR